MQAWVKIISAALPALLISVILLAFLLRRCMKERSSSKDFPETQIRRESLQSGITKLHLSYNSTRKNVVGSHHHHKSSKKSDNYYVFRNGVLMRPLFNWADRPWLVSEAVEHGWTAFAFAGHSPTSLPRSTLWDFCTVCDYGRESEVEISWEVCSGSAEYMQKIRLNSGSKKIENNNNNLNFYCVSTALPLPGPPLGNLAFPQEAYFEITILSREDADLRSIKENSSVSEDDRIKLMPETIMKSQSNGLVHVNTKTNNPKSKFEELESKNIEESQDHDVAAITVGLCVGGSPPLPQPGSYSGSIGFNSDGSIYLDGLKLPLEDKKIEWGGVNRVIGCGFDPSKRKVFYTIDSELVHTIHCKPEEFESPLYPTLAANVDVTVLVNMGQSAFKYAPADLQRTPNPCFLRTSPNSQPAATALGYDEDSRELFSMGRIDAQWLNRSTAKNSNNTYRNNSVNGDSVAVDVESEGDLFEISLDNLGRSP